MANEKDKSQDSGQQSQESEENLDNLSKEDLISKLKATRTELGTTTSESIGRKDKLRDVDKRILAFEASEQKSKDAELSAVEKVKARDITIETLQKSLAREKITGQVGGKLSDMGYHSKYHSLFTSEGVDDDNIDSKLKEFDKKFKELKTSPEASTETPPPAASAANLLGGQPTSSSPPDPLASLSHTGRALEGMKKNVKDT